MKRDIVKSVAAKLVNDNVNKANYTTERAKAVLSNCVAPVYCISVLEKNEQTIINLLN